MRKQEGKIELQNLEIHRRICVKDITFFGFTPYVIFVVFSCTPSLLSTPMLRRKKTFASEIGVCACVCVFVCVCVWGGDAGTPPPPPAPPDVGLI